MTTETIQIPLLTKRLYNFSLGRSVAVEVDVCNIGSMMMEQAGSFENIVWSVAKCADDWSNDYLGNPSEEEVQKAREFRDKILQLMSLAKEIDRLFDEK